MQQVPSSKISTAPTQARRVASTTWLHLCGTLTTLRKNKIHTSRHAKLDKNANRTASECDWLITGNAEGVLSPYVWELTDKSGHFQSLCFLPIACTDKAKRDKPSKHSGRSQ